MTDLKSESITFQYYSNLNYKDKKTATILISNTNPLLNLNDFNGFNISQIRFNNLSNSMESEHNVWQFFLNNRNYFINHDVPDIDFSQKYYECPQLSYFVDQLHLNHICCESSHYDNSSYTFNMDGISTNHHHDENVQCVCGDQSFRYYLKNLQ